MPPEYEKLPVPNQKEGRINSLENILTDKNSKNTDSKNKSNLEKMILKELRERN